MRRAVTLGGLTLAATALSLGLAELAVRVVAPQPTKISVPAIIDPELIYRLPANARGTDVKEEFAVRIETNALGLRDRDYPPRKPEGTVSRLLVLGDSMTFAEGVEAEEAYPNVLERALTQRHGPGRYEVINAAIRGYGNDQELILFERLLPALRPDAVLLAFYPLNDFEDNLYGNLFALEDDRLVRVPLSADASPKYRYYRRQSRVQTLPGYRMVIARSHLVNLLRHHWARFEFAREFSGAEVRDPEREERAWRLTRAILARWADLARARGVRPFLLLIPSATEIAAGRDPRTEGRAERVLAFAAEVGVPVFDPRPALRAAAGGAPVYYPKDGHMTAHGHRAVAAFLEGRLGASGAGRAVAGAP